MRVRRTGRGGSPRHRGRRGAQAISQHAHVGRGTSLGSVVRAIPSAVQGAQGTFESLMEDRHHAEDRGGAWGAGGESSQAILCPEGVVPPKVIGPRGRRAVRLRG